MGQNAGPQAIDCGIKFQVHDVFGSQMLYVSPGLPGKNLFDGICFRLRRCNTQLRGSNLGFEFARNKSKVIDSLLNGLNRTEGLPTIKFQYTPLLLIARALNLQKL